MSSISATVNIVTNHQLGFRESRMEQVSGKLRLKVFQAWAMMSWLNFRVLKVEVEIVH